MPPGRPRIAVVGAGWAGLAAAVDLLDAGAEVTVFEAARFLGGRAREVEGALPGGERVSLDNGQHILIGAYRDTLALMTRCGADPTALFWRTPVRVEGVDGFRFAAAAWPAPWHVAAALVGARGLSLRARADLVRLMLGARARGWRLAEDEPVARWLARLRQDRDLISRFWAPLCVAALNTPIAIASAQVFQNVLRDSIGSSRSDSDLLVPRAPLSALFPGPAVAYLERGGATVQTGTRVQSIAAGNDQVRVTLAGAELVFDGCVCAVSGHQVPALLAADAHMQRVAAQCAALTWQPIATAYLQFPAARLKAPMLALTEDLGQGLYGQWVFDKGQLGGPAGLLAVVISAQGPHQDLEGEELLSAVSRQLALQCGLSQAPVFTQLIREKRATFACTPGLDRPQVATPRPRLVLAGDFTASDYPATLETAVRSGREAARQLLRR